MASAAYQQILQVQDLDLAITQLRHRVAHHPLRADLAGAEAEVAAAAAQIDEIEGRRAVLDRDLNRLGDETATLEAKRTASDAKLYDGSVTATKELLAIQEEVANLAERQRAVEDDQIVLMEEIEVLDGELAAVRTEHDRVSEMAETVRATLTETVAEIEAEIAETEGARARAAAPAVPELLARYEELAGQYDGVAVARFHDGRCDGCHMQLSAVAVDQLAKAPDDAVVTCEECGRLLVR